MHHSFDTEVAEKYGMPCAAIFQWMLYWVEYNRANGTNFHDGKYWVYNSNKALQELFPYIGKDQMRAAIKKLVDADMLVTGCYNSIAFDRTMWYSIGDEGVKYSGKPECLKPPKGTPAFAENPHISCVEKTQISSVENPHTNTIIEPLEKHIENIKEKKVKEKDGESEPKKKGFGELENVFLSAEEYAKLLVKMGDIGRDKYIEAVSLYKGKSGRTYKSDYAACLAFWQKDGRPVENSPQVVEIHHEKPDLSTPEKIREAIFT